VELRIFAEEELARELQQVPGVANVDVSGGVEEQVQVNIDLQRLQAAGIDLSDVLDALRERNQDVAPGACSRRRTRSADPPGGSVSVRRGTAQSAHRSARHRPAPAGLSAGCGHGVDGIEEQRVFVNLNQQPAVKVSVQKQPDANTVKVVDGVKAKLEQMRQAGIDARWPGHDRHPG
jgi:multidrug efflux pump subunit AcrB